MIDSSSSSEEKPLKAKENQTPKTKAEKRQDSAAKTAKELKPQKSQPDNKMSLLHESPQPKACHPNQKVGRNRTKQPMERIHCKDNQYM